MLTPTRKEIPVSFFWHSPHRIPRIGLFFYYRIPGISPHMDPPSLPPSDFRLSCPILIRLLTSDSLHSLQTAAGLKQTFF